MLDDNGPQEMIEMQGVPIYDDALYAACTPKLFDHKVVSGAALKRMAGNSFSQPCMTAFLAFTLAHLTKKDSLMSDVAAGSGSSDQVIYGNSVDADANEDDDECDDDIN